ncbi:MAG TPA: sensor histidine kinase KdpD [Bauldia sp.]|nr:sensor histidine kinase KdpD [Bauldia sp.]
MADVDTRPEPEALLAEAAKEGRGKLKVFLGAAPGVGKTYAMLEDARRRKSEGTDVVVALVETHGRSDTEALLAGIEAVPRRRVPYRDRLLTEMDLDAVLARRPQLALIDELAHSNVPDSRHPKRWQDVEEVLEAGIDVYTTLNIQHLESLNDIVARISKVRVRETIPDKVLELADEIELIDLPPEELITRLRQGKVYVPDQIARAVQNFFSKGNLTALRELAMRVAADRVDAQMIAHMRSRAIAGPWPTEDRILVCINESPVAKTLVRTAKRAAERARAPWIAVHVMTPSFQSLPDTSKDAIADATRLAESLGAEVVTLNTDSEVVEAILDFARSRNVSRIIVGRPRPRRLLARFSRESVGEKLIHRAEDFELTLVSPEKERARQSIITAPKLTPERDPESYLWAIGAVAAATGIAYLVDDILPVESLALVFLVPVLAVAARLGLWPSLCASVVSFLVYNFFFTEPHFTLNVADEGVVLTLFLFLAVAILTGNLAARLRSQVAAQRGIFRRTANLYAFSRKIAGAASFDDVVWAAVHHVASTLQCRSLVLSPAAEGHLAIAGGYPPEDQLGARDWGAAKWAWERGEPAGWSSQTLPSSEWLFLPLKTTQGIVGVLGVSFESGKQLTPDDRRLLDTLVDQVAIAIERARLTADIEESRVLSETERLRAALLSSVSHDLRTPLVSILGAATSLLESGNTLSPDGQRQLAETIRQEGERLNRYVQNLLDMTRISYGALSLKTEWIEPRELVGRAMRQVRDDLRGYKVSIDVPLSLPVVRGDPVLLQQTLVNVLDNAGKYAPAGTEITVSAAKRGNAIVLAVTDQGPGIPEADRERVFDMFYRVRGEDSPNRGGTGLGLAIARGILEAHGGTVRALAGPRGMGTRVEIELPLSRIGEAAQPKPAPVSRLDNDRA